MKKNVQNLHAEALAKLDVQLAVLNKISRDNHKIMDADSATWLNVADLNHITDILNEIVEFVSGTTL